jgi:hypothetical protein
MTAKQDKKVGFDYLMKRWSLSEQTIRNYTKRGKRGVVLKSASPGKPLFWLSDVIAFEQAIGVSPTTAKRTGF